MANPSAILIGCEGTVLSPSERRLIARHNPLGLIVFRRNSHDAAALKRLTAEFRALVGRADAPVLIDQEGGRVQRLRPPEGPDMPAPRLYGLLHRQDSSRAIDLAFAHGRITALLLADLGVSLNAAPVLDLVFGGASAVVGDRSFDDDPQRVAILGRAMVDGMSSAGVTAVMKHLPGHGRATVDSHQDLPRVDVPATALEGADFKPFSALADLSWGMTAHVLYPQIDPDRPATLSPTVIQSVIREIIGFQGLLTTDDLAMGALTGEPGQRVAQCLEAGCDIALYCDPSHKNLASALEAARPVDAAATTRLARWRHSRTSPTPGDWRAEFARFSPPAATDLAANDRASQGATPVADR